MSAFVSRAFGRFCCVAAGLLLAGAWPDVADAQSRSGPIVMRSANSSVLQWWIVDPGTGVAAFYGGDIVAICKAEPGAHDLLDLQEVDIPNDANRRNSLFRGKRIGASLWDRAPPFNGRLCADILARGAPMATGTADLTFNGADLASFLDPDNRNASTYGMNAHGTMRAPDGQTLRVNAHYRCRWDGNDNRTLRCTQGVAVN